MNVRLHIDRLVLEEMPVAAGDGEVVRTAVETELTRLLTSGEVGPDLRGGGARLSIPVADVHLSGSETPISVGRQIGRAIYGGIEK